MEIYYYDTTGENVFEMYMRTVALLHIDGDVHDDAQLKTTFTKLMQERKAVGRSKFLSLRPKNVKRGAIRECSCPICRVGWDRRECMQSKHKNECGDDAHTYDECPLVLDDDVAHDVEFEKHLEVVRKQREYFDHVRTKGLKRGQCMVVVDFSPYSRSFQGKRSMSEAMCTLQCLHCVVYKRDGALMYFDYFSGENNDVWFVRSALFRLVQHQKMNDLTITHLFSDGAAKHFKNRRSLGFTLVEWALMTGKAPPIRCFFASNHGKSSADARKATVQTFLNKLAVSGVPSIGVNQIVSNINNNKKYKLAHRDADVLETVSHKDYYDWTTIPNVKKYHSFMFTNKTKQHNDEENKMKMAYEIECKQMCCDDECDKIYINPISYEFDKSCGGVLDVSVSDREAEQKHNAKDHKASVSTANEGVRNRKRGRKSRALVINDVLDVDDDEENSYDDDEMYRLEWKPDLENEGIPMDEFGVVEEKYTKKWTKEEEIDKGTRIAVRFAHMSLCEGAEQTYYWPAATVHETRKVRNGVKKDIVNGVTLRTYVYGKEARWVYDDPYENQRYGEWDIIDHEVRLLIK